MDIDTAHRIYGAYCAIFEMKLKDSIRREMLTWALTENADHWPVVGITHEALRRFAGHEFKYVTRMGIHRAHLSHRRTWQSEMLQSKLPLEAWLDLYRKSDQTVLATSNENMMGKTLEYLEIPVTLGLFRSIGYRWRHGVAERDFLQGLHAKTTSSLNA